MIIEDIGYRHWNDKTRFGLTELKSFDRKVSFKKNQVSFKCRGCDKTLPKRTRYILDKYSPICFKCSELWFENSINKLLELSIRIKAQQEILTANKEQWDKEIFANSI